MARLLVVGLGPLLEEGSRRFGGQCLRTWYFTKPLLDDGHTVRLVTLPIYDPDDPNMHKTALVRRTCEGFQYQAFTNCDLDFAHQTLTDLARSFDPDGIIGVNMMPAWVASRLRVRTPMWADLNGYEMAEKQGQAARTHDDTPLDQAWKMESTVARRADKLSTVSRPQLHALLGEMAGLGRLNQHTFQYHFVHHIPNAAHPAFSRPPDENAPSILRGKVVPDDAFVLLWSGGYNFWTDPRLLFDVVEEVLRANQSVHYVSTGGAIAGYDEKTYAQFEALVQGSAHRNRYHLLGWVPSGDLPGIYWESDLGLNIDEPNYETFFGARNRINNLMAAGLPVLTTAGSEIATMIDEANCGIVCPPGDIGELTRGVLSMVHAPEQCLKIGKRAREFAMQEFSADKLTYPVRDWAEGPFHAPDNAEKLRAHPEALSVLEAYSNALDASASVLGEADILALRMAEIDLKAIRSKLWYRTLKELKDSCIGAGKRVCRAARWVIARAPPKAKAAKETPKESD